MKRKIYVWIYRILLNLWPCIWSAGGRVVYLSEDFTRLKVRLSLKLRTRNVVGTIFGGSMYASTDPFYMLMLMEILGTDYVVWDKGCTIRFKKPAKAPIYADFHITPDMLESVRTAVAKDGRTTFTWMIQYRDREGTVYAEFDKVLYVATKRAYKERLKERQGQGA